MQKDNAIRFRPEKPAIYTRSIFDISTEDESIRVKNENVNVLYNKLTAELFDKTYNFLDKYLDLDFSPIIIDGQPKALSNREQIYLEQVALAHSIYFYVVNSVKIVLKPNKISPIVPLDEVIALLDRKYGIDTLVSMALGARVLRRPLEEYCNTVKSRRQYYNK